MSPVRSEGDLAEALSLLSTEIMRSSLSASNQFLPIASSNRIRFSSPDGITAFAALFILSLSLSLRYEVGFTLWSEIKTNKNIIKFIGEEMKNVDS